MGALPVSLRFAFLSRLSRLLVGTMALSLIAPAVAFSASVPVSVDPAKIEERFQPGQEPLSGENAPVISPPQPSPPPAVTQKQASKRFTLSRVVVEGATVYSASDLAFAYEDSIGKDITLNDAQAIAQRITTRYRNDGYILSQAVVPQQEIIGGALTVRIVEGYIADVHFEGDLESSGYRPLVEEYAEHIKSQRPLKISMLERYLLLMDDLPGATAKGLVRPSSSQFGSADLVVTLSRKAFEGSFATDNRGTDYVGPWQHTATLAANSVLGLAERTVGRLITASPTDELHYADFQHEEQIGSEGTRLLLVASYTRSRPADSLSVLDIDSHGTFVQARAIHPFIRSRQENLVGRVMLDARSSDTDLGAIDFTEDRLRVVRVGAEFDTTDSLDGVVLVDAQISEGLDIFNATDKGANRSRANGEAAFTKINLDVSRTQALPMGFSVLAAASGQYSLDTLLAAEEFTLGGIGFGQAYDPAELSGDSGLAAKLELRYGQAVGARALNSYQLYSYYDIGRVWDRNAGAGGNDKKSLASAGVGVRANFVRWLSGNAEFGVPLTKQVAAEGVRNKDPRLFVGLTGRF